MSSFEKEVQEPDRYESFTMPVRRTEEFNLPARRNLSVRSLWRKHLFSHPVRSSFLPWIPSKTLFIRICTTQFNVFAGKPDYNALR